MILLALLPIILFCLLWLFLCVKTSDDGSGQEDLRKSLILTGLVWSAYLALGTELLSLVGGLTPAGAALLWIAGIVLMGAVQWRTGFLSRGLRRFKRALRGWKPGAFGWAVLFASLAVLVILLVTGLLSPPNVQDVLSYHMSRVMHWAQNQSLRFYPTPNPWQLWMPPFGEISQLNLYLLSGKDTLSSLPQWTSLVLMMAAVSLTAKRLGAGTKGQWLSAFFILTLPIIILQASGKKNDLVMGFFFAALVYYVVESSMKNLSRAERAACGLSVGLGVLTKGTFPFYILPFLIWLLVNMLRRSERKQVLGFMALGLLIVLTLNGGHWLRNALTFGNPIYSGYEDSLINGRFGLSVTLSNLVRNSAVQLNGRYGFINEAVERVVTAVHDWLKMPVFDPQLTQGPGEFYYVPNREEVAGNPFHFALAGLSLVILLISLFQKRDRKPSFTLFGLALSGVFALILFSTIFRWQSWNTRLLIPYYIAFAPVIGVVFGRMLPTPAAWLTALALGIVMVNPLLNNYSRSFSWAETNRNSIWRLSRKGLLFANNQNIEGAVLELTDLMAQSGCRTYGVLMRSNAPEYLLWGTLRPDPGSYELQQIQVKNRSSIHSSPDFDPCGIILFEMTDITVVDQNAYHLIQRWQIGDTTPFSLLLKPDFIIKGME